MNAQHDIAVIEDVDRALFVHLDDQIEKYETATSGYLSLDGNGYADRILEAAITFPLVLEVEFNPSFSPDDGESRFIFNATNLSASHRWILRIVADLIQVSVRSGGALLYPISINLADYQTYWNDLDWNKIRCVLNPAGNSKLYLNETEVVNSNSLVSFTPSSAIDNIVVIGASSAGASDYVGLFNYIRTASTEENLDSGNYIYDWEFNGNYVDSADGLDLTEQGTGNTFVRDSEYYEVLGHQPDKKALAELDEQIPLIWIKRKGPPTASTQTGSSGQTFYQVRDRDGEDNPLNYDEVVSGSICDITYEVRYICFHEDDERAMVVQLNERFPKHGRALSGPGGEGPFLFELALSIDVPGIRKDELGGLFRIVARDVAIGDRRVSEGGIAAIKEIQQTVQDYDETFEETNTILVP